MEGPKFEIGQRVKFEQDSDVDAGEVIAFFFENGEWSYKITSKEVDYAKKDFINGVKIGKESELVEVKEEKVEEEEQ